jgi:hypothetical protein
LTTKTRGAIIVSEPCFLDGGQGFGANFGGLPFFIFHAACFPFRALAQRAAITRFALSLLCFFVNFAAEAFPPIECVFGFVNGK